MEALEAYPVGEAVRRVDGRSFFEAFEWKGQVYRVKDCVQVNTSEEDDEGDKQESQAERGQEDVDFAQITAIFEDPEEPDAELQYKLEVRWFVKPADIRFIKRKKIKVLPDELIESRVVDDIPLVREMDNDCIFDNCNRCDVKGAVNCPINVNAASDISFSPIVSPKKRPRSEIEGGGVSKSLRDYTCRYLLSEQEDTLLPVTAESMWERSKEYSMFASYYDTSEKEFKDDMNQDDPYSRAVAQLHISVLPAALPCREEEQNKVHLFLKSAMTTGGRKRPLYISGMPGTGKTATVHAAVSVLKKESSVPFEFIEINCLRISSPNEAYTVLWRGLSGEFVNSQLALQRLKSYFEDLAARANAPSNAKMSLASTTPTNYVVCLLDELDYLVTKNESIVYNFFDWPQQLNSGLVVIGIANTMDLPERLNKRSLSRLGGQQLMRIAFKAYTHEQINSILTDRLQNLDGVFESKSLQLTARKAASTAGDLRSALKICQRAIELHRDNQLAIRKKSPEGEDIKFSPVTLQMVTRAAAEYKENPLMVATASACNLDKAIFIGMCRYNSSTGVAEMTLDEIWDRTSDVIHDHGRRLKGGGLDCLPPWSVFHEALARLMQQGMLVVSGKGQLYSNSLDGSLSYNENTMISPRLLHSDIMAALKDVQDPLAALVWPVQTT